MLFFIPDRINIAQLISIFTEQVGQRLQTSNLGTWCKFDLLVVLPDFSSWPSNDMTGKEIQHKSIRFER